MKGFVMSGLKAFSCVVVLCGAMANVAIASPKIEARGELGRFWGGAVGAGMGGAMGGMIGSLGGPWNAVFGASIGSGIGAYSGADIGDRVEDFIRGVDREPQTPREPTYDRDFGHDR
ncbi:pantothenate kinase [Helicobacter pylori]|uniref:pantothenate kinase n=1 Tax=Helicobacter pylori TaxID=210 RepID=UPI0009A2DCF9|nr:pantothenate kinase [Helicobacter pylori]OPG41126.1 pantothenate kinase [Helicobacter pylori]